VRAPRLEAAVQVDGVLDEPAWQQAALLTGFSQYLPADGIPAADTTEVLVWYSPTAIHFGIRAHERHTSPQVTLADRDRIGADDWVQILLGTFHDSRQALVFMVNPLGVQADGVILETGQRNSTGSMGGGSMTVRDAPDLSPDFIWQSKGRVTDTGFEVEIRIPFKSLKFQERDVQTWDLNIVRRVQHSSFEDSWAPVKRASATFLGQSGTLEELTGLSRGLVLDVNPTVVERVVGNPEPGTDQWGYGWTRPEVGANVRWGVTNNLTLNATVNPDFSQVESDVGQFNFDPRQALFFPERRPFFLEGIEQFNVPNQLIYTRRIVQPIGSAKLTGKTAGTDVALLTAFDDRAYSASGEDVPFFAIARLQRDVGRNSRLGVAYTNRMDGGDYSRVADVDGRLVFAKLYQVAFQGAYSWNRTGDVATDAPLWELRLSRTARESNIRYTFRGISDRFNTQSGFIRRRGIAQMSLDTRYTLFGRQDDFLQSVTGGLMGSLDYRYQDFVQGRPSQDRKFHINLGAQLKGGWSLRGAAFIESFGYDSALYAGYALEQPLAGGATDTIPFTGTPRLENLDWVLGVTTPQWKFMTLDASVIWGRDENFFEWASGDILFVTAGVNLRPTDKIRTELTWNYQSVRRPDDGSLVNWAQVARAKVEYQINRWIFVRLIGQYQGQRTDSLRDNSRTEYPILVYDSSRDTYVRAIAARNANVRGDFLFSYQPTPGTVFFFGYGSTLLEPDGITEPGLRRAQDSFFLKVSYLWRM